MKTFDEFKRVADIIKTPNYDSTRFDRLIESESGIDGLIISPSKISSISRFYERTNSYNRSKITELINTNIRNVDKVHKLAIDYEKYKQKRD